MGPRPLTLDAQHAGSRRKWAARGQSRPGGGGVQRAAEGGKPYLRRSVAGLTPGTVPTPVEAPGGHGPGPPVPSASPSADGKGRPTEEGRPCGRLSAGSANSWPWWPPW